MQLLIEAKNRILDRLAELFVDHRKPDLIEHSVRELIGQRVFGLVLGYEDLNDHNRLRFDPLLAAAVGKLDPTGQDRRSEQDRGKALASSSTLNRLELTAKAIEENEHYKKIVANPEGMDRLLVDCFVQSYEQPPREIWIDLDATDDPTHGRQERRFFHGYYGHYCYLRAVPLQWRAPAVRPAAPVEHRCGRRQRRGARSDRRADS